MWKRRTSELDLHKYGAVYVIRIAMLSVRFRMNLTNNQQSMR